MFENVDFSLLLLALGVIFSGCLAVVEVYQAYNKYALPKKKKKMLSSKRELSMKSNGLGNSIMYLERTLKSMVETNKLERSYITDAHLSVPHLSANLKERLQKCCESYDRLVDMKKASEAVIILSLQQLTCEHLPNTCKEYNLADLLNSDELKQRYLNGKEVTKHWIEETYPTGIYELLMDNLKEKETKLDLFFKKLNETFQDESILNRFRKEKRELMESGHALLTDLRKENEKLKKELEKYSNIENAGETQTVQDR